MFFYAKLMARPCHRDTKENQSQKLISAECIGWKPIGASISTLEGLADQTLTNSEGQCNAERESYDIFAKPSNYSKFLFFMEEWCNIIFVSW